MFKIAWREAVWPHAYHIWDSRISAIKGTWYTWSPKTLIFLRFVWYFYQAMMYQKSEWHFFDQGSIDGKSEVKVEKCHLVAELKLKMLNMQKVTFSILTPPPGGTFELILHFSYLWNIAQKSIIQILDTLSINNFHWNFAPCISGILNFFDPWNLVLG